MYSLYPSEIFILTELSSLFSNALEEIPSILFSTSAPFSLIITVLGITKSLFVFNFSRPFSEKPEIPK